MMTKTFTIREIAARYGCTRAAVALRAKVRGVHPSEIDGQWHLFTAAQVRKLGPGKRGPKPRSRRARAVEPSRCPRTGGDAGAVESRGKPAE